MATPRPDLLRSADLRRALALVGDLAATHDGAAFAHCGVQRLGALAASELTTLSLCALRQRHRHVMGAAAIGCAERAAFDRYFASHPLVRYHGIQGGRYAHRISDSLSSTAFRHSALYADYYRPLGIDHAIALPLHQGDGWLVGFVLNRRGRDFSDRELALLDAVRAPLAQLFARTGILPRLRALSGAAPALPGGCALSARERQVLRWVSAGKTDRDVAAILGISARTVHKHLQHIYTALGVETRTAAVMRALAAEALG